MKKAVIYGAGQVGVQILWNISYEYEVLGFVDRDERKWHLNGGGE